MSLDFILSHAEYLLLIKNLGFQPCIADQAALDHAISLINVCDLSREETTLPESTVTVWDQKTVLDASAYVFGYIYITIVCVYPIVMFYGSLTMT